MCERDAVDGRFGQTSSCAGAHRIAALHPGRPFLVSLARGWHRHACTNPARYSQTRTRHRPSNPGAQCPRLPHHCRGVPSASVVLSACLPRLISPASPALRSSFGPAALPALCSIFGQCAHIPHPIGPLASPGASYPQSHPPIWGITSNDPRSTPAVALCAPPAPGPKSRLALCASPSTRVPHLLTRGHAPPSHPRTQPGATASLLKP